MNGNLTRDIIACIDENDDFDMNKFLSMHPMTPQLEKSLNELEILGLVSIDRKYDNKINDFDITEAILKLRKRV